MVGRIEKTGTISGEKLYASTWPSQVILGIFFPPSLLSDELAKRCFHAREKIAFEKYFVFLPP